jgi:hypothetical protein
MTKNVDLNVLVAESAREFSKVVSFFHGAISNYVAMSGKNFTDFVVSDNVDDPDHLFLPLFEVEDVPDVNGKARPNNVISIYAEEFDVDSVSVLNKFLFVPGEHDQAELTGAWVRYFTNVNDIVKRGSENPPDSVQETLDALTAGKKVSVIHIVKEIFYHDPALMIALHDLLHQEKGAELLHMAIKMEETMSFKTDVDYFHYYEAAAKEYFIEASRADQASKVMDVFGLINMLRGMPGSDSAEPFDDDFLG